MSIEKLNQIYDERIEIFNLEKKKLEKQLIILSILRFVFFLCFTFGIFFLVKIFSAVTITVLVLAFVLFIFSVIRYIKITDKLKFVKNLIRINTDEKKAIHYQYNIFNNGETYIDREHPYSFDLDLFGEGSFFQFLNRTATQVGRDLLASKLLNLETTANKISSNQEALQELAQNLNWRHDYLATGYLHDVTQNEGVLINDWIDKPVYFIKQKLFKILIVLMPTLTLSALIAVILGFMHYSIFTFLAVSQLFIISVFLRKINHEQAVVSKQIRILKNYSKLIDLIAKQEFNSLVLSGLKNELNASTHTAASAFKKLIKIIDAFDTRLNIFLGVILNATLMWDIFSVMRLERWKIKYGHYIKQWVKVIAEFDAYCSMANFAFNNPEYVYPKLNNEFVINAKNLGHPLIPKNKRINNDFVIKDLGSIDIITGANMAGKSTFLRTIGINMILAHNGMPVCAAEYKFKIIDLFSGMRTSDSLKENESYFYAELKRLKYIIENLEKGNPTLVLLDEILKGTNSIDKAKGSKKFVEHLVLLNATGIVATHDLTLCDIEKKYPNNISNKCFEIEIDGENIYFDYKLKPGVTNNMNASILMSQMGLFKN